MLSKIRVSWLRLGIFALLPMMVIGNARPVSAQGPAQSPEQSPEQPPTAPPAEAPTETITICRYDPNSGVPNVLGMRTYISLTESEDNTVVTLDRFPSVVTSAASPDQRATVSEVRSLILYDTSVATARQLLVDQPAYYAALMEIDDAQVGEGFAPINETLGCGQVAAEPTPAAPAPAEPAPEGTTEAPETEVTEAEAEGTQEGAQSVDTNLAMLPNGNYRFVSAEFPNRVVSDTELAESGGAVFLFRKFGENITGTYRYVGQDSNVCIAGIADGNTVVGTAYQRGDALPEDDFLTLGEAVENDEYEASRLNAESFSRINAGSRLPLESCS